MNAASAAATAIVSSPAGTPDLGAERPAPRRRGRAVPRGRRSLRPPQTLRKRTSASSRRFVGVRVGGLRHRKGNAERGRSPPVAGAARRKLARSSDLPELDRDCANRASRPRSRPTLPAAPCTQGLRTCRHRARQTRSVRLARREADERGRGGILAAELAHLPLAGQEPQRVPHRRLEAAHQAVGARASAPRGSNR